MAKVSSSLKMNSSRDGNPDLKSACGLNIDDTLFTLSVSLPDLAVIKLGVEQVVSYMPLALFM